MAATDTDRDPAGLNRPLTRYLLRNVGYEANEPGQLWQVWDYGPIEAIRQLDGFADASFAEPISDVRGCSTFAVYRRVAGTTSAAHTKIGCVRDETPLT